MKKIFNKFKQFSRDIKLLIIGALIMSCIGVYATGSCIIAATAEDITYNNTTVQAAIDELYSMSQSYCPPGYECRFNLYRIMARDSVLDDTSSTYVTNSSGINLGQISSDTNGKGIYEIASTKNDTYPIYYYRGAVTNNNVKFGGFCWKAIRTTDTGGVKLIYNGEPDGSGNCTNTTGSNTQIGTSSFNTNQNSLAYIGYMYGTAYTSITKYSSELNTQYKFGKDVTYSNGTYTLTNTITTTGTWSNDYTTLNNNHYTCWTTGTTCTSVYYVYYTTNTMAYYIVLTDGKKVNEALDEMFNASNVNTTDSVIKTAIDTWYNTNLSSYTSYIEDTVYCNERGISELNGWNPNGGSTNNSLYFTGFYRMNYQSQKPNFNCSRALDKFTVSSSKGNGKLTYPVGLITIDEIIYAGGRYSTNSNYYLYTDQDYWTISPSSFSLYGALNAVIMSNTGGLSYDTTGTILGVRPVISLKIDTIIESGDGTQNNPYVIKTS